MADQAGSTEVYLTGVFDFSDSPRVNPSQLSPILLVGARFLLFFVFSFVIAIFNWLL